MRLTHLCKYGDKRKNREPMLKIRNKLFELENIEEELGIDLITLFKAFKSRKFYIRNVMNDIIDVKSDVVRFDIGHGYVYFGLDYCPLSSYGKTWALTKEELL